ncbi:hypothetical protein C8R43DRAFT_943647 [Mycena crocata]|nr:hypothetical protein C8R43DRAFT_943647 [Mycena crocata]
MLPISSPAWISRLIPWPKTPPPTRTHRPAKALGQLLTTRSRGSAAPSDSSGTVPDPISMPMPTLPKHLRLTGPKQTLNTTGFKGSIASSASSVPSSAVLPASIPIPLSGTQTKLAFRHQFTVPPSILLRPFDLLWLPLDPVTLTRNSNNSSDFRSSTPLSKPPASSSKAPSIYPSLYAFNVLIL